MKLSNIKPMPDSIVQKIKARYDRCDTYRPGERRVDYFVLNGSKRMAFHYMLHLATVWSAYFNTWRRGGLN